MAAAVATLIVAGVSFGSTLRLHGTKVAPARSRIVMADVGGPYTLHAHPLCHGLVWRTVCDKNLRLR